jgi:hypothetical protein
MEQDLWDRRNVSLVKPLFANYQAWFWRRLLPGLEKRAKVHTFHFPGDLCVEVEIEGAFPLCVVGLNPTWQQYEAGDPWWLSPCASACGLGWWRILSSMGGGEAKFQEI